ncbi:Protein of unknown function [Bacillus mycoides]|uniref:Uncharacterized protein n=1 Tax=Bacillus mycoides TaxID=1405 RepID=A0A1D3MHL9_BACMY|nr:Protein of unknown function [Bacillus mycoides]SCM85466.1 Protein of unknown function [Bacillus mycoides]
MFIQITINLEEDNIIM